MELELCMMRLEYHHLRQDDDQAIYWAAHYTKLVSSPPTSSSFLLSLTHSKAQERSAEMQHLPALHLLPCFKTVADMLVQTGKWRLLKHMLCATHEWSSSYRVSLLQVQSYRQLLSINFHDNCHDEEVIQEEGEEEEEYSEDNKEDAAEGLETGAPTWWASQVIWGGNC